MAVQRAVVVDLKMGKAAEADLVVGRTATSDDDDDEKRSSDSDDERDCWNFFFVIFIFYANNISTRTRKSDFSRGMRQPHEKLAIFTYTFGHTGGPTTWKNGF